MITGKSKKTSKKSAKKTVSKKDSKTIHEQLEYFKTDPNLLFVEKPTQEKAKPVLGEMKSQPDKVLKAAEKLKSNVDDFIKSEVDKESVKLVTDSNIATEQPTQEEIKSVMNRMKEKFDKALAAAQEKVDRNIKDDSAVLEERRGRGGEFKSEEEKIEILSRFAEKLKEIPGVSEQIKRKVIPVNQVFLKSFIEHYNDQYSLLFCSGSLFYEQFKKAAVVHDHNMFLHLIGEKSWPEKKEAELDSHRSAKQLTKLPPRERSVYIAELNNFTKLPFNFTPEFYADLKRIFAEIVDKNSLTQIKEGFADLLIKAIDINVKAEEDCFNKYDVKLTKLVVEFEKRFGLTKEFWKNIYKLVRLESLPINQLKIKLITGAIYVYFKHTEITKLFMGLTLEEVVELSDSASKLSSKMNMVKDLLDGKQKKSLPEYKAEYEAQIKDLQGRLDIVNMVLQPDEKDDCQHGEECFCEKDSNLSDVVSEVEHLQKLSEEQVRFDQQIADIISCYQKDNLNPTIDKVTYNLLSDQGIIAFTTMMKTKYFPEISGKIAPEKVAQRLVETEKTFNKVISKNIKEPDFSQLKKPIIQTEKNTKRALLIKNKKRGK